MKRARPYTKLCSSCSSVRIHHQSSECRGCYLKSIGSGTITQWLDGLWDGSMKNGILSATVRNFLLEEAKFRCQSLECCVEGGFSGVNKLTGKTVLTIEHIDGDATNHQRDNLLVLCPNCHSQTETYCALNKGKSTRVFRYAN